MAEPNESRRLEEIERNLNRLENEMASLRAEKARLGGTLSHSQTSNSNPSPSNSAEKIELFLKLFRCRESVYPVLWENVSKATKGYSPACTNEWVRGICDKPRTKCSECPNQAFPPFDATAVEQHLLGRQILGTYAIRENDTCTFLACDFDGNGWTDDVLAYVDAARAMGVDTHIERSRSGNGAHAWIFFSEPVAAVRARKLGTVILAKAMAKRPNMPLKSYDRFFPNQDTLPKGGFGNLIALPLQKLARERGNTEFLREDFTPFENQWDYLAKVKRISAIELNAHLTEFMPPQLSVLPEYESIETQDAERLLGSPKNRIGRNCYTGALTIEVKAQIKIPIGQLPSNLISAFRRTAIFANPEFFRKQRMRFSTWDTPRYVCCDELLGEALVLPRGSLEHCLELARMAGADLKIADLRPEGKRVGVSFSGELTTTQTKLVELLSQHEFGVLVAPPGSGKTVMACALIAKRDLKTLILVHTKALVEQWRVRLTQFLSVEESEIETIGKKSRKKQKEPKISVATIQTFRKLENAVDVLTQFGHVVVDECHHMAAVSFETVLKQCSARYVLGLTATPYRKDGHQAIIHMQCGPIRHEMKAVDGVPLRKRVIARRSFLEMENGEQIPIHEVWDKLVSDTKRLKMITDDIVRLLEEGRSPIVLSERMTHLELLEHAIKATSSKMSIQSYVFVGGMSRKSQQSTLEKISSDRKNGLKSLILATGAFVGEGFDLPFLDTLILAMPISFKGKLVQYSGRLHRAHPGKSEVQIWDYFDAGNPLTISMFKKRIKTYKLLDYKIEGLDRDFLLGSSVVSEGIGGEVKNA